MKKTTLMDIVHSLETLTPEVKVPEEIRKEAIKAVEGMIALKK
jgi:quinolinate synthase